MRLLDQGLPRSTVHHLDAAGVESANVGEKGLATASDAKIIDFARKMGRTGPWCKFFRIWSGLSESNRHLNLGKVRGVESNALELRHLADLKEPLIGK